MDLKVHPFNALTQQGRVLKSAQRREIVTVELEALVRQYEDLERRAMELRRHL